MIACEPGKTFDYVLPTDKKRDVKPTFKLRVLTIRETREIIEMAGKAESSGKFGEACDVYKDVVSSVVTGFENMPDGFCIDDIESYVTTQELRELAMACIKQELSEDDLKN